MNRIVFSLGWTLVLVLAVQAAAAVPEQALGGLWIRSAESKPIMAAKWIWHAQAEGPVYNQTIIARKSFQLDKPQNARMLITADSFYRLYVNGQWVADGPCRCWPEHYQYDVLDVSNYVRDGNNQLEIVARHYGVGDFHKVPQRPGLWRNWIWPRPTGSRVRSVPTHRGRLPRRTAWVAATPKVSIQMEPFELYDCAIGRRPEVQQAQVLCEANGGPWKDLHPRDVALMTRQPVAFQAFGGAKIVKLRGARLLPSGGPAHAPRRDRGQPHRGAPCGMATILETPQGCTLHVELEGMRLAVDGRLAGKQEIRLPAGKHLVLAYVSTVLGHDKEKSVRFLDPADSGWSIRWMPVRRTPGLFYRWTSSISPPRT